MSKYHFLSVARALMTETRDFIELTSRMLDDQINRKHEITWKYYFEPQTALKVLDLLVQANVQPEVIQNVFHTLGVSAPFKGRAEKPVEDLNTLQMLPDSVLIAGAVGAVLVVGGLLKFIIAGVWLRWLCG